MLRRAWSVSLVLLSLLAPGCALWLAERRLAPAAGQLTAPGPPVRRHHELVVLVEHDTSTVHLAGGGGTVIAVRLGVSPDVALLGWGPLLPALPFWLVTVPQMLLCHRPGEVVAILEIVGASDWPPVLSVEAGDLLLAGEGQVVTSARVTATSGRVEAVFRVRDPMGPLTLSIRRLQVGVEVLHDLGTVRFEPDLALTLGAFP